MNILSALSSVPSNLAFFFGLVFLIAAGLVVYALRTKGYVRAVFSHGKTTLELEAKERSPDRK
jgi:hypothetical protein